jgi:pimeloyl-ACP methyl ester carboxylesterase
VLAGHSMGGMTLQAWAARYPEQVERRASAVMLVNTTSGNVRYDTDLLPLLNRPLTISNKPITVFGSPIRMPALVSETVLTTPVPLPGGWPVATVFKSRVMSKNSTADEVNFSLGIVRSCRPLTRGKHAAALADLQLGDAAKHLTVPTTVIAGSNDHLLPERMSRTIAETLSRTGHLADYYVWPTGHLGNIEAADRFNAVLEQVAGGATLRTAEAG